MTLSFAPGQAYVALSRATCLETPRVRNLSPGLVFAHPGAVALMRATAGGDAAATAAAAAAAGATEDAAMLADEDCPCDDW